MAPGEQRRLLSPGPGGPGAAGDTDCSLEAGSQQPTLDGLLEAVGLGRWNVGIVLVCGLANGSEAVEAMCMGYILPELPPSAVSQLGFLSSAIFVGMLFGGLLAGGVADRYGRRPCLLLSLGLTCSFGLLSAVMPTWTGVACARVMAGFGVGGAMPAIFTLGSEVVPRKRRGLMLNIIAAHFMVGTVGTAALAWAILGGGAPADGSSAAEGAVEQWRIFAALCALPSGLAFLLTCKAVPESPRFLAVQGRGDEALALLRAAADKHGRGPQLQSLVSHGWAPAAPQPQSFAQNVRALCAPRLRRTTLLLAGVWAAMNFGFYGLFLWLPTIFRQLGFEQTALQSAFLTAAANFVRPCDFCRHVAQSR